jgi:VWFA-related protein
MNIHRLWRSSPVSAILALAVMLLFAGVPGHSLAGAQSASPQDKPLQHEVGVSFKLVQVYVTAKGGRAVGDLTAEDFTITDNGKPQQVAHFERHFLGTEASPAEPSITLPTNRKFFLIFDFAFMDSRGVLKSKDAALKFLDTEMRPTDEIGLITYSANRGLVLHEYLTSDHGRIRKIVEGFGLGHFTGRAERLTDFLYAAGLDKTESGMVELEAEGIEDPASRFYENQARLQTGQRVLDGARQSYVDRARTYITSLRELAKVFRLIPGFKNVVLFSGGIARQVIFGKRGGVAFKEWTTTEELIQQLGDYDAAHADSTLREDFTEMLKDFKASNSPVFAIDVSRTARETDVSSMEAPGVAIREMEGADSLRQLASGTGGKFYANTVDNVKVASDIQTITGAYYVLGFYVDETWDGKFHKIKVGVNRKGLNVVAQGGYFSAKPFRQYTSFEKLLHVVDLALSDTPQVQIPYEIPVGGMPLLVKGWPQLLVFGQASLTIHTEVLGKRAEAYLLLSDEQGDLAHIKRFRLDIPESGKETVFPSFLLAVKPGSYTCSLVVRNMDTGRGARGLVPLVIPPAGKSGLALDPPLFLVPVKDPLDLGAQKGGSLAELFGYDPNAFGPLLDDLSAGPAKLRAALRLSGFMPGAEYEFTASLLDGQEAVRTDIPVAVLEESGDRTGMAYIVEVDLGELAAGRYVVEFKAQEKGGTALAAASGSLRVK